MIILITGNRKGIGRYLSEYYLERKHIVLGCSRSESDLQNKNYRHYLVDVSKEEDIKKMVLEVKKEFGKIDVLINNAGIASMNLFLLTPTDTARRIMETNYFGTLVMCREFARLMRKSNNGRIINFTTVAKPLKIPGELIYAASKAAIETLTQILAKELAQYNITVNAIGPTPIKTDLIKGVPEEKLSNLLEYQAIKRFGKREDVANVIDFYIQPESNFITGQIIYLGGIS